MERRIVEGHTSPPRACRYPQNQVARTHSSPGSWRIAVAEGPLRRNAKEFDQIAAQNRLLIRIAEERRVEDEINAYGPVKRIVCPIDHVTDADFRDQMPQALLVKNHRIDIELVFEILAGFFLERLAVG